MGLLDGHAFKVRTEEIADGRKTAWEATALPLATVRNLAGSGPLSWFDSGVVNFKVQDEWTLNNRAAVELDWQIGLEGVTMALPSTLGITQRAALLPLVTYINSRPRALELRYNLVMNEREFESVASLEATGIWQSLIEGLARSLSKLSGEQVNQTKEHLSSTAKNFKDYLDARRK